MKKLFPSILLLVLSSSVSAVLAQTALQIKPDELWVMAGDSLTVKRMHTNYIEAFYRTRYPALHPQFRNAGRSGHKAQNVLERFDYDIATRKPTIVSIELGQNDVSAGDNPNQYIDGIKQLIQHTIAIGARPVLLAPNPINDGSRMNHWKSDRSRRLHLYTEALGKLAAEEKLIFVDQYHPLLELWANNWQVDGKEKYPLGGDPVHPGEVGQLTMAATILAGLGADGEVSSATLTADGRVLENKYCEISAISAKDGLLVFTRLDQRGPWPIASECRDALRLMPQIANLSRYLLKVTGLAEGQYTVAMNGTVVARLAASELAAGWNMGLLTEGVVVQRNEKILQMIGKLQGHLNEQWRYASWKKLDDKMVTWSKAIDEAEIQLAEMCKPVAIRFEIRRTATDAHAATRPSDNPR